MRAVTWYQRIHWHASRKVAGGSVTSRSFISAISSRLRRTSGCGSAAAICARGLGVTPNPVLHAEDDIGQAGVEAVALRRVDLAIIGDLLQQAAEAELQADGEVGAEMLRAADAAVDLVFALLGVQVREVEIGVPVLLPIRHEVDHRRAGERGDRIDVDGMPIQQRPEAAAHRNRPVEAAAGVVALDRDVLQPHIVDHHAGAAHRLDDLPIFGRREDQPPVVVVHRADDLPLLGRVRHLGRAQRLVAGFEGEGGGLDEKCWHGTSFHHEVTGGRGNK